MIIITNDDKLTTNVCRHSCMSTREAFIYSVESNILQYFGNEKKNLEALDVFFQDCEGDKPNYEIPSSPDTLLMLLVRFASMALNA